MKNRLKLLIILAIVQNHRSRFLLERIRMCGIILRMA